MADDAGQRILVSGTIRLAPEKLEEARPAMTAMIEASRAEDGCLAYHYAVDLLDPGLIHVTEVWSDDAALRRHFASQHIESWRAQWPRLGIGERDLRIYPLSGSSAV